MIIKELRDSIDKIDDGNLERLLQDIYDNGVNDEYYFGKEETLGSKESFRDIDITDYIPIPYSVVKSEKTDED